MLFIKISACTVDESPLRRMRFDRDDLAMADYLDIAVD
jgi:hypothetical protein